MNKFFTILSVALIAHSVIIADGFEGNKKEQANTEKWVCKFCPEQPLWDVEISTHLGLVTDEIYHYANYTGIDDDHLYFSGHVRNISEDGRYWISSFENIGTDAAQLNSRYGIQGSYQFKLDFKSVPVRKFDGLSSVFTNPGATVLRLDDNWNRSNNTSDFSDPCQVQQPRWWI